MVDSKTKQLLEDTIARSNPDSASAYVCRGLRKSILHRYSEAIEDFDKAISLDPADAVAYAGRGCAKNGLGQYSDAIEDLDKAISLDPNYAVAYKNLGVILLNQGKALEALEQFNKAVSRDPKLGEYAPIKALRKAAQHYNDAQFVSSKLKSPKIKNSKALDNIVISLIAAGKVKLAYLCTDQFSLFLEKISQLDEKVLEEYQNPKTRKTLFSYFKMFSGNCDYFVDNNKIMPSYKLSKAHGRRVFGDLPPMLRDDNGDITAVPKITDTG
ncbi:MAG: tetratricopeptide repeat protein, partial [Candidatus Woesearchaeota archaeon]